MSLAFMFPGQGAQHPGMLRAIGETGAATTVLADAKAICADLGLPADLDSAAALSDTVATQVSLVIVGVACARGMSRDHGLFPRFVAGHSAGAFAATVVAGVLTLREALTAVKLRGESMRAACARGGWGMAAVRGLPTRAVQQLTIQVGTSRDPLWVANINTATQTVLGGTTAALAAARYAAREAGATGFDLLDIAVASHGQVQDETARTLRAHLAAVPLRDPTARYLTNTGGRSVRSADAVIDDLADSAARPVRWYDGVRLMAELGVTCALEMPPGHTSTRTVATIAPHITTLALSDVGARAAASLAGRCARASSA